MINIGTCFASSYNVFRVDNARVIVMFFESIAGEKHYNNSRSSTKIWTTVYCHEFGREINGEHDFLLIGLSVEISIHTQQNDPNYLRIAEATNQKTQFYLNYFHINYFQTSGFDFPIINFKINRNNSVELHVPKEKNSSISNFINYKFITGGL